MRLIDATRIEQYILNNCSDNEEINTIYAEIINAPTVDAVPIVRCKDCVYCKRYNDVWYLPKRDELLCTLHVANYHTTENDFCSWGERKEDETKIG